MSRRSIAGLGVLGLAAIGLVVAVPWREDHRGRVVVGTRPPPTEPHTATPAPTTSASTTTMVTSPLATPAVPKRPTPSSKAPVPNLAAGDACVARLERRYGELAGHVLNGVAAKDGVVWTTISEGGVAVSSDGGRTWRWNCDDIIGHIGGIVPTSARVAWLWSMGGLQDRSGSEKSLYRTDDGGARWHEIALPDIDGGRLDIDRVAFATSDSDAGWIVASTTTEPYRWFLRTRDRGRSWETFPAPIKEGAIWSLSFSDAQHGWLGADGLAGGGPALLATDDGGDTWSALDLGADGADVIDGRYVARTSATSGHVFVTRSTDRNLHGPFTSSLLSTTDGGRSWLARDLPVEALAVEGIRRATIMGRQITGYSDSHGYTGPFVAHSTDDAGRSWVALSGVPDLDNAAGLAIDGRDIWIQGQRRVLGHSPDQGKTWTTVRLTTKDL